MSPRSLVRPYRHFRPCRLVLALLCIAGLSLPAVAQVPGLPPNLPSPAVAQQMLQGNPALVDQLRQRIGVQQFQDCCLIGKSFSNRSDQQRAATACPLNECRPSGARQLLKFVSRHRNEINSAVIDP